MTLLRRILLYYALTLLCSLGLVGFWSWVEFGNQIERIRHGGIEAVAVENTPSHEALEIVFFAGLPAVLIGLVSLACVVVLTQSGLVVISNLLSLTPVP